MNDVKKSLVEDLTLNGEEIARTCHMMTVANPGGSFNTIKGGHITNRVCDLLNGSDLHENVFVYQGSKVMVKTIKNENPDRQRISIPLSNNADEFNRCDFYVFIFQSVKDSSENVILLFDDSLNQHVYFKETTKRPGHRIDLDFYYGSVCDSDVKSIIELVTDVQEIQVDNELIQMYIQDEIYQMLVRLENEVYDPCQV